MPRYASIPQSASLTHNLQSACPRQASIPIASLPFTQGGLIIGITGGTGCGKTTLLSAVQAAGGLVLDCDAIYHGLLNTDKALLDAIDSRFPGTVEGGVLQRKKLGDLVFANRMALLDLNRITHGAVKREVIRRLETASGLAAIDAIALFEGGLAELCHVTVAVTAPVEDRVRRLVQRDGITEEYARRRIAAQHDDGWFRSRCHYVLVNDGEIETFQGKCVAFLRDIGIMGV